MTNKLTENVVINVAITGAAIIVGYFIVRNLLADAVTEGAEAVANVNQDTPYEGFGIIGTAGNVVNRALGGLPERIGSFIGGKIADLTGK